MPLQTTDTNMLRLIDILKDAGIIRFREEFYQAVGVNRQYVNDVKKGTRHFTVQQIERAYLAYGVRPDFIFGVTDKVFLKTTHKAY
jgi:ABC-type metal ion transport system substrate-binding protein